MSGGANGLPLEESDYRQFAEDLLPGRGALVLAAWQALGGAESGAMWTAAERLAPLAKEPLTAGPLKGLLFGDPGRFVNDLVLMLRLKASFLDFVAAAKKGSARGEPLAQFIEHAERWQLTHGYENAWWWPGLIESLKSLDDPSLAEMLKESDFLNGEACPGNTPFERIKFLMARTETFTPRLLQGMKRALWARPREA